MAPVSCLAPDELVARYDVFFLDAYGVLVSGDGALPGAAAFLRRLARAGKEYLVVSNDASRSPATSLARYRGFGLDLDAARILTSGLLLTDHFAAAGLRGSRCIVLGTEDSCDYVRDAGGIVTAPDDDQASVLVVGDDDGYPFLETVNAALTVLLRRLANHQPVHLVLPNPDLIFPTGAGGFGITAGAIAALVESVLRLGDPGGVHHFVALGKPNRPIFEAAVRRFPGVDRRRMVMLGDQLATDILGARRFGLDAVLVQTGVGRIEDIAACEFPPTHTLAALG